MAVLLPDHATMPAALQSRKDDAPVALRILIVGTVCVLISGCATYQELTREPNLRVEDLVLHVRCDLSQVIYRLTQKTGVQVAYGNSSRLREPSATLKARRLWLDTLAVRIGLSLIVDASDTGSGEVNVAGRRTPDRYDVGGEAFRSRATQCKLQLDYYILPDELEKPVRTSTPDNCPRTKSIKANYRVSGSLGAGNWLVEAVRSFESSSDQRGGDGASQYPSSVTFQTNFSVKASDGIVSGFKLVPLAINPTGGGIKYEAAREPTNRLTVTMVPAGSGVGETSTRK